MRLFCRIGRHNWEEITPKHRRCKACGKEEEFYFLPGTGGQKGWLSKEYVDDLRARR